MTDYLEKEKKCIRIKSPEGNKLKISGKLKAGVLLLWDNAPDNIAEVIVAEAVNYGFDLQPHSPYSLGVVPPDFFLFFKLKYQMRGRYFGNNN